MGSVLYKGAIEWNNLDVDLRLKETYAAFKSAQKIWLTLRIPTYIE